MYNQPYFIPSYYSNITPPLMMRGTMGMNNALRGAGMGARALGGIGAGAKTAASASRGLGLFSRLGSSLSTLRGINWGGFINNASKTLGVINQTIPLVRQVGPMMNNMKSMLKVASLFKDETDLTSKHSKKRLSNVQNISESKNNYQINSKSITQKDTNSTTKTINYNSQETKTNNESYDSSPTFFISS